MEIILEFDKLTKDLVSNLFELSKQMFLESNVLTRVIVKDLPEEFQHLLVPNVIIDSGSFMCIWVNRKLFDALDCPIRSFYY